jgi:hypothetical protein
MMFSYSEGTKMREQRDFPELPSELQLAREIALKAASDIATQAEFASLDAGKSGTLQDAAKRFGAIIHYAERALQALERVNERRSTPNSVQ